MFAYYFLKGLPPQNPRIIFSANFFHFLTDSPILGMQFLRYCMILVSGLSPLTCRGFPA